MGVRRPEAARRTTQDRVEARLASRSIALAEPFSGSPQLVDLVSGVQVGRH